MIASSAHVPLAHLWLATIPPDGPNTPGEGRRDLQLDARMLRVLIVEDEFFISLDMKNLLQGMGHVVVGVAVSADEAVQLAQRENPDVALMDIRLIGVRDGIEAAEEISARFGVPSLFVTANTDPHTRQRAQAVQPVGFLEKPVTAARLRAGLRSVATP